MKRFIIAGTIALLAAVTVGTAISQDSLLEVFAANDMLSQLIRVGLIGLLVTLLVTSPPRSMEFRTSLAVISACLTFGVALMLSNYQVAMLDAVLFVEVAIIFALEAIESPVLVPKIDKKLPVSRLSKLEKS